MLRRCALAIYSSSASRPTSLRDMRGTTSAKPARLRPPISQRYLADTMTVETRWSGLLVTDYLEHYAEAHTPWTCAVCRVTTASSALNTTSRSTIRAYARRRRTSSATRER